MATDDASMAGDRPLLNCNFRVDLGGSPTTAEIGFCEVIFPAFEIAGASGTDTDPALPGSAQRPLLLRRGVTGELDIYRWWNKARRGRAPQRRTVKVHLLSADQVTVAVSWIFRNARPLSLSYSPLNALQGEVQLETLALVFDSVEMRRG